MNAPHHPVVEAIFTAPRGGAPMRRVDAVYAVAGEGLEDDRYRVAAGYWSRTGWDICEVTLIAGEDLDVVTRTTSLSVQNGEHRRNIVTRGLDLAALAGWRLRLGAAELIYTRPRPPCRHLGQLTHPDMTRALRDGRSGVCARIVTSGVIRVGDTIYLTAAPRPQDDG